MMYIDRHLSETNNLGESRDSHEYSSSSMVLFTIDLLSTMGSNRVVAGPTIPIGTGSEPRQSYGSLTITNSAIISGSANYDTENRRIVDRRRKSSLSCVGFTINGTIQEFAYLIQCVQDKYRHKTLHDAS